MTTPNGYTPSESERERDDMSVCERITLESVNGWATTWHRDTWHFWNRTWTIRKSLVVDRHFDFQLGRTKERLRHQSFIHRQGGYKWRSFTPPARPDLGVKVVPKVSALSSRWQLRRWLFHHAKKSTSYSVRFTLQRKSKSVGRTRRKRWPHNARQLHNWVHLLLLTIPDRTPFHPFPQLPDQVFTRNDDTTLKNYKRIVMIHL